MSEIRHIPEAKVVLPTKEQREQGLREINHCLPFWMAEPGMLIIKPTWGVIVSFNKLEYDDTYFTLTVNLLEALFSPPNSGLSPSMNLRCIWNQPYLSISRGCLSAPYSFYLHFGREGVKEARALNELMKREHVAPPDYILSVYRGCFHRGTGPARSTGPSEGVPG